MLRLAGGRCTRAPTHLLCPLMLLLHFCSAAVDCVLYWLLASPGCALVLRASCLIAALPRRPPPPPVAVCSLFWLSTGAAGTLCAALSHLLHPFLPTFVLPRRGPPCYWPFPTAAQFLLLLACLSVFLVSQNRDWLHTPGTCMHASSSGQTGKCSPTGRALQQTASAGRRCRSADARHGGGSWPLPAVSASRAAHCQV